MHVGRHVTSRGFARRGSVRPDGVRFLVNAPFSMGRKSPGLSIWFGRAGKGNDNGVDNGNGYGKGNVFVFVHLIAFVNVAARQKVLSKHHSDLLHQQLGRAFCWRVCKRNNTPF